MFGTTIVIKLVELCISWVARGVIVDFQMRCTLLSFLIVETKFCNWSLLVCHITITSFLCWQKCQLTRFSKSQTNFNTLNSEPQHLKHNPQMGPLYIKLCKLTISKRARKICVWETGNQWQASMPLFNPTYKLDPL